MRALKRLGWGLFYIGLGGSFALLADCVTGANLEMKLVWCACPILAASAAGMLVYCYRREPPAGKAPWHLRLTDLLFLSLGVGILLGICSALRPRTFGGVDIVFALSNGIGTVFGLLRAQRLGLQRPALRWLYAAGFGALLVGLISFGALLAAAAMDGISYGQPFYWANVLLNSDLAHWAVRLHRMCLACLPVGCILIWAARLLAGGIIGGQVSLRLWL